MPVIRKSRKRALGFAGFSMMELLIAMVAGLFVIGALYRAYIFQDRVQGQQERLMEANQNARNGMDVLSRDLRVAGLGVPSGVQFILDTTNYQNITVSVNYYDVSTTLTSSAASGATTLNVSSATGFAAGNAVYVSDGGNYTGPSTIASASGTQIVLSSGLGQAYPTGSTVNVVDTVTFDYAAANPRELRRKINSGNADVLANDIDYLQIRYYDSSGAEIAAIGSTLTSSQRDSINSIDILLVARTSKTDSSGSPAVTFADGSTGEAGYERVYLKSEVRLRNM